MRNFSKNSIVTISSLIGLVVLIIVVATGGLGSVGKGGKSLSAAVATADLSVASNFAVLAGASIVDSNLSTIVGDIGLSAAAASFIAVTCPEVTGTIYGVDATYVGDGINFGCFAGNPPLSNKTLVDDAKLALTAAYTFVANETPATTLVGSDNQLGGQVLGPGIYTFSAAATANLIGTVTLDGGGDPNAVFVFQTASSLVTDSASVVSLTGSAQSCNVFWQVGTSATLGTGTQFVGTIMADQSITDAGGSTVDGRLLASVATVTLNNTDVTVPGPCTPTTETITVIKTVVGGPNVVADFPLFINGSPVTSGITNSFAAPATYTVTETSNPNYMATFSGDCPGGIVSLTIGLPRVCTVTNTYTAPSSGGGGFLYPPLIDIVKVPSPLALPNGPGGVTYTYTLRNVGIVPVNNITLVGDTCSPIILTSGDTNADARLDVNETWVYHCSTTLSATHTNTVVATGTANGITATDIASATVIVGGPIPPLIHVTKIPNPLSLQAGGGMVTYTNKVTNPGTVALNNIRLDDDKCGPVNYISGDTNADRLLDSNETWTYTCTAFLAQTTTNTIVASGDASGMIVRDFAIATVVVSVPGLPQTGFPPRWSSE